MRSGISRRRLPKSSALSMVRCVMPILASAFSALSLAAGVATADAVQAVPLALYGMPPALCGYRKQGAVSTEPERHVYVADAS